VTKPDVSRFCENRVDNDWEECDEAAQSLLLAGIAFLSPSMVM
jgi:hypothetical protein